MPFGAPYTAVNSNVVQFVIRLRESKNYTILQWKTHGFSNQNAILAREVGDIVQVELTPPGSGGSPAQISTLEIIDSISYSITPDIFTSTIMLSNADRQSFFRLDNTLFGVLDTDKLGY